MQGIFVLDSSDGQKWHKENREKTMGIGQEIIHPIRPVIYLFNFQREIPLTRYRDYILQKRKDSKMTTKQQEQIISHELSQILKRVIGIRTEV